MELLNLLGRAVHGMTDDECRYAVLRVVIDGRSLDDVVGASPTKRVDILSNFFESFLREVYLYMDRVV